MVTTYDNSKPIIDIVFLKDPNGYAVNSNNVESATLVFCHPDENYMRSIIDSEKGVRQVRAPSSFERKINKNTIYINFPTYKEQSGGYGYDLGFTEDTVTISMLTAEWSEYERVAKLVKVNNGDVSGYIHIGLPSKVIPQPTPQHKYYPFLDSKGSHPCEEYGVNYYKVIVRTCNVKMDPGKFVFSYDLTCTIVYDEDQE